MIKTLNIVFTCVIFTLYSCINYVKKEELYGTYAHQYEEGKDIFILLPNNTFYRISEYYDTIYYQRGKWKFYMNREYLIYDVKILFRDDIKCIYEEPTDYHKTKDDILTSGAAVNKEFFSGKIKIYVDYDKDIYYTKIDK